MKLFVLGNINAGKSYVIEKLRKNFPEYDVLKIDEWRIAHCDGSIEKEEAVWEEFPRAVLQKENVIVEFCGGGKVAQNIVNGLADKSCIVLKVCTDTETCVARIKDKNFAAVPYPQYPGAGSIEDTIRAIGAQMQNGSVEELWREKAVCIFSIDSGEQLDTLPLRQYEKICKLKKLYTSQKCEMFLFGSAARRSMTVHSDVDVFLLSARSAEEHCAFLKNYFESCSVMGNEVVIREDGVLVELDCITDVAEAELFYSTGQITDAKGSVLIGGEKLISTLEAYAVKKCDFKKELQFTTERLWYYVLSLPPLIGKEDEYKYYFHNNIIIHEYVRLKAFLHGVFEHSYLPRYAKQFLSNEEWQDLVYNFGDDRNRHYQTVRTLSEKLLSEVKEKWR